MRGIGRLRRVLRRPAPVEPVRIETPQDREAAFRSAGEVLTPPAGDARGIFLVNGTRLRFFEPIADELRREYATVLVHFWAVGPERLAQYRAAAGLFDAVVSPGPAFDPQLSFAPIYRSNGMDLLVDDTLFALLDLPRDIEVADSTSVPWTLKRPLFWLAETRAHLDRTGAERAVYLTKRAPGEKEDARCHREWERFLSEAGRDGRVEVRVRSSLDEVVETLNRTKFVFHPSTSEFAPRAVIEALYCGALAVAGPFAWVETMSVHEEVRRRVLVRDGLRDLPEHDVADIRRWQTARRIREGLIDFLAEHGHRVNGKVGVFTMFSSKRVDAV
jgi:hypothetical protein